MFSIETLLCCFLPLAPYKASKARATPVVVGWSPGWRARRVACAVTVAAHGMCPGPLVCVGAGSRGRSVWSSSFGDAAIVVMPVVIASEGLQQARSMDFTHTHSLVRRSFFVSCHITVTLQPVFEPHQTSGPCQVPVTDDPSFIVLTETEFRYGDSTSTVLLFSVPGSRRSLLHKCLNSGILRTKIDLRQPAPHSLVSEGTQYCVLRQTVLCSFLQRVVRNWFLQRVVRSLPEI